MLKTKARSGTELTDVVIDQKRPGAILADFEALLGFIGTEGVRATGKYHLLPLARLAELDERMTAPLRPRLARPQQRSYPHLHGLYLLLRATQLAVPEGMGRKEGKLVRHPEMFAQWQALNPTERYFNLLEAWLRIAEWEMAGDRSRSVFFSMQDVWSELGSRRGFNCTVREAFYSIEQHASLALLELFGCVEIERGEPKAGENWRLKTVRRTRLGEVLIGRIIEMFPATYREDRRGPKEFGRWQQEFQPFFPEWRNNLEFPKPEFRDGVHFFKVSLGKVWRRIAMPADADMEDLAQWIIKAFKFDGDHLYGFELADRNGSTLRIETHDGGDPDLLTTEISVGYLPIPEKGAMRFAYDYGASWEFQVVLERIDPSSKFKKPKIVESHGKAPAEYEDEDEEW